MTPEQTINPVLSEGAVPSRNYGNGPGRTILLARESARLGLDQLAQQTKLTRATLDALERDDFSVLTEAVYVRGYYRKVAKALGLSEQELISAYEGLVAPKAPPAPTKLLLGSGDNGPSRSRRRANVLWVVAFVVVVVLIMIVVKFVGHSGSAVAISSTSSEPSAAASTELPPPSHASGEPVSDLSSQSTRTDTTDTASSTSVDRQVSPAASQTGEQTSPSTAAAADPGVGGSATPAPPDALVLQFKTTSWVRVEDGNGKLLLSGVIQSGDRQVVNGKPPYAVFLGNAPGVSLEFQSKSVNIKPFIKDNATARFSVP